MDHGWRRSIALCSAAILAVTALFWPTAQSMMDVWARSRTYAHGFLVLPVTGYLVWCYRDHLRGLSPVSNSAGPVLLVILVCFWEFGRQTETLLVQQIAVVAMLPAVALAFCGIRVLRVLAFPLGFLGFALPVGTSFEPWLQTVTSLFIGIGLDLTGIPHQRDGILITLSSGIWEVAPDCGGLRYLLPGLALGYVYTAVMHHTLQQRVSFLFVSALLLIAANGVRASGIIIGDHFGIAEGTDHRVFSYAVYGWTVLVLGWLGLRWSPSFVCLRSAFSREHIVESPVPLQRR